MGVTNDNQNVCPECYRKVLVSHFRNGFIIVGDGALPHTGRYYCSPCDMYFDFHLRGDCIEPDFCGADICLVS